MSSGRLDDESTHNRWLSDVIGDFYRGPLKTYLSDKDLSRLSRTNRYFRSMFDEDMLKRCYSAFLHAVLDEDQVLVNKIIKLHPEFILKDPPERMVLESKYTWQRFYAEPALLMAVKRKQLNMIQLLLEVLDRQILSDESVAKKKKYLEAWRFYDVSRDGQEIIIPEEYLKDIFQLYNAIEGRNPFLPDQRIENPNPFLPNPPTESEAVTTQFRKKTLPNIPTTVDHIDPVLYLCVVNKLRLRHVMDRAWREYFLINVHGWLQSLVVPEMAKVFCQGIYNVVVDDTKISERCEMLKLDGGKNYYRASREATVGLGYEYHVGSYGWVSTSEGFEDVLGLSPKIWEYRSLNRYMLARDQKFREMSMKRQRPENEMFDNPKRVKEKKFPGTEFRRC